MLQLLLCERNLIEFFPDLKISFIHFAVCLTTGPKPLPKRALHIVRSRASSFKWGYPLLCLMSSSSFLRLLPRLPVTSILLFIFPSISRCRRQFLRKMWPIQLAFRLLISCRIFLCSLTIILKKIMWLTNSELWRWMKLFLITHISSKNQISINHAGGKTELSFYL